MTTVTDRTSSLVSARAFRALVRDRLEQEYLRLRSIDRSTRTDAELAVIDRRIAAVHDHLGTVHDHHPGSGIAADCCAVIDAGDGPHPVLVCTLDVVEGDLEDLVVRVDSSLGRALLGSRAGDRVRFTGPAGPAMARVVALESGSGETWD